MSAERERSADNLLLCGTIEVRGLYGVHNMEAIYTGPIDLDKVMEFIEGALGTFEYGAVEAQWVYAPTYYTREQLNELQRYCSEHCIELVDDSRFILSIKADGDEECTSALVCKLL